MKNFVSGKFLKSTLRNRFLPFLALVASIGGVQGVVSVLANEILMGSRSFHSFETSLSMISKKKAEENSYRAQDTRIKKKDAPAAAKAQTPAQPVTFKRENTYQFFSIMCMYIFTWLESKTLKASTVYSS